MNAWFLKKKRVENVKYNKMERTRAIIKQAFAKENGFSVYVKTEKPSVWNQPSVLYKEKLEKIFGSITATEHFFR